MLVYHQRFFFQKDFENTNINIYWLAIPGRHVAAVVFLFLQTRWYVMNEDMTVFICDTDTP
jgi:hypothetical protein